MTDPVPPAPVEPRSRRLRRSTVDRDLAGVLGGLGRSLDVDANWLRLATVAATGFLAFRVGSGAQLLVVLPYAVAWAFLPTDGAPSLMALVPRRAVLQELGLIGLLVVVSTIVATRPGLGLVAVLGGVAALLLRDRPASDDPPHAGPGGPPPATADPLAADDPADDAADAPTAVGPAPTLGPVPPPRRSRPPRRPRREPALWPLAAGLVAVVGVLVAAGLVAGWVVDVRVVVNVLLAVVGGVMLLSAWRGRARVLLLAGPLLLPVWFATSAADIGGHDGAGWRAERPAATPPTGPLSYELGYGRLEVDLTDLDLAAGSRTPVEVAVSVGSAQVTVPFAARVEVVGEVGLGVVDVPRDRWGSDTRLVAHRRLDLARGPLGPVCEAVDVTTPELRQLAAEAGLAPGPAADETADDALLDAIEDAGFPRPQVVDQVEEWYGDAEPVVTDIVSVHVTTTTGWALCEPQPPDPDPPVVVIDATIGLGTLEVHRA